MIEKDNLTKADSKAEHRPSQKAAKLKVNKQIPMITSCKQ